MRLSAPTLLAFPVAIFIIVLTFTTPVRAQIVASEFGTVSQTVDGTTMTFEYSRPSRRGRAQLFGEVMQYGQIITPGANWATTFEINKGITIDGVAVPAGKYSVWIAFEENEWEFLLDETWQRFHGPHPTRDELEYGVKVRPMEVSMETETLLFSFPSVQKAGATLRMQWGTTAIEMDIEVEPTPLVNITAEQAALYSGIWTVDVNELPPFTMYSGQAEVDFKYENGYLHVVMDLGPYTDPHDVAFFPKAEQVLFPVLMIDGEPSQTLEAAVYFEFAMGADGQAESFEARVGENDVLWLSGRKSD